MKDYFFLSSSPSYRHCCRHHRYHHHHHHHHHRHHHFCGNQKLKPAFNNDVSFDSSVWRLGGPVLWQEHQYTGASYRTKYDPPQLFCEQLMPLITLLLWDSLPTEWKRRGSRKDVPETLLLRYALSWAWWLLLWLLRKVHQVARSYILTIYFFLLLSASLDALFWPFSILNALVFIPEYTESVPQNGGYASG